MKKGQKHHPDYWLIGTVLFLLLFGLVMLASVSAPTAYEKFQDSYYFVKHQLFFGLLPGLLFCLLFSFIPYYHWKKFAGVMLLFSLVLLAAVFIPSLAAKYGTAKSWVNIAGFSFQPCEIVKLTLLIYLAAWLEKRGQKKILNFYEGFLPFIILLVVVGTLLILQPDFGSLFVLLTESLVVYYVAGGSLWHLSLLGLGGFSLFYFLALSAPYRLARLTIFLHPELDPKGIGYHINQAFLAIGSGGWLGRGYGLSRQKFQYLPEVIGDSIFAVIAEELGFLLCVGFMGLFLLFFFLCIRLVKKTDSMFGQLLVVGIASWILCQVFVNVGGMVGVFPMTGVTLPFISAGGTSLVMVMAAIGIMINISKYTKA